MILTMGQVEVYILLYYDDLVKNLLRVNKAGIYKNRLRVTPLGALVAIVGGGSAALISKLFDIKYLDLGGLLISGLLLFVVSFIDDKIKSRKRYGTGSIRTDLENSKDFWCLTFPYTAWECGLTVALRKPSEKDYYYGP